MFLPTARLAVRSRASRAPGPRLGRSRVMLAICALALPVGCAEPAELTENASIPQASPLFKLGEARLWTRGNVPVCFSADASSRSTFASEARTVRWRALTSWPTVAKIALSGWGRCTATRGDSLAIGLLSSSGAQSTVGMGVGTMNLGVERSDFETALVPHELGHVLAFTEEMERSDFVEAGEACKAEPSQGSALNTPADVDSIMASTGYCQDNPDLSLWDAVGVQTAYGRRLNGMSILVNLWSSDRDDHAATASTTTLDALTADGYAPQLAEGWLFTMPVPGTVPLQRFRHPERGDTLLTATASGSEAALADGYEPDGSEGYVYASAQPGTVALKQYVSTTGEYFVTTHASAARGEGYREVRVEGYLFADRPYDLLWSYTNARGDTLLTKEASALADDAEDAGYTYGGFDGALLRYALPGTVELRSYRSKSGDTLSVAGAAGQADAVAAGHTLLAREGYVFSASAAGLTPLRSLVNGARTDTLTTASTATRTGYTPTRTEGHVLALN